MPQTLNDLTNTGVLTKDAPLTLYGAADLVSITSGQGKAGKQVSGSEPTYSVVANKADKSGAYKRATVSGVTGTRLQKEFGPAPTISKLKTAGENVPTTSVQNKDAISDPKGPSSERANVPVKSSTDFDKPIMPASPSLERKINVPHKAAATEIDSRRKVVPVATVSGTQNTLVTLPSSTSLFVERGSASSESDREISAGSLVAGLHAETVSPTLRRQQDKGSSLTSNISGHDKAAVKAKSSTPGKPNAGHEKRASLVSKTPRQARAAEAPSTSAGRGGAAPAAASSSPLSSAYHNTGPLASPIRRSTFVTHLSQLFKHRDDPILPVQPVKDRKGQDHHVQSTRGQVLIQDGRSNDAARARNHHNDATNEDRKVAQNQGASTKAPAKQSLQNQTHTTFEQKLAGNDSNRHKKMLKHQDVDNTDTHSPHTSKAPQSYHSIHKDRPPKKEQNVQHSSHRDDRGHDPTEDFSHIKRGTLATIALGPLVGRKEEETKHQRTVTINEDNVKHRHPHPEDKKQTTARYHVDNRRDQGP